ncbi:uncharacterized protein JCM15063_005783 [Sporobolomyces koalae]|uniref:uncharacterized protein n=1 Tax=Sporobolomyces koalae TaxID=500713 RepID=UPI00317895FB
MNHRTFQPLVADALDTLLSLHSTPARHAIAISQIEAVVAPLALDPHPKLVHAFLASQDRLDCNIVSGLLEWLGRSLVRIESFRGSDADAVRENMLRCLALIQGLLLLHRRSQRLFARKSSLEYLVAILESTRATVPATALRTPNASPLPSPVLSPTSPAFPPHSSDPLTPNRSSLGARSAVAEQLAIATLDTLLCALVDRPKNARAFEEVGGLVSIVGVLKDRNVAQAVRIKVIELLYYYLLPESESTETNPSSTSSARYPSSTVDTFSHQQLPSMLADAVTDFVPQTPTKPRTHQRSTSQGDARGPPSSSSAALSSRDPSPSRTPQRPRGLRHKRSQSLLNFPTSSLAASLAPPQRTPSQPIARPALDVEATPRPRFVRSSRNPLQPIPASPDLARSRPSHRRTQSIPATPRAPPAEVTVGRETSQPASHSSKREDRETAMLPPPVPLSRSSSSSSASRTAVTPSHRRSSSTASIPLPRSTAPTRSPSLTESSRTNVRRVSRPEPAVPARDPNASYPPPPPSPTLSTFSAGSSPGYRGRRAHAHVRSEHEKKEMLRKIMPNVDALEQRFKMMGLGFE